jgi:hypothetical protein
LSFLRFEISRMANSNHANQRAQPVFPALTSGNLLCKTWSQVPESRFHAAHFNAAELEASAKIVEKAVQARSLALRFSKQEAGQERKLGTEVERLEQCIGRQKQQACKIM